MCIGVKIFFRLFAAGDRGTGSFAMNLESRAVANYFAMNRL